MNYFAQRLLITLVCGVALTCPRSGWSFPVEPSSEFVSGQDKTQQNTTVKRDVKDLLRRLTTRSFIGTDVADAEKELFQLGSAATPDLLNALNDDTSSIRYSAAWYLAKIKDPKALPILMGLLSNPQSKDNVRELMATALGNWGDRTAAPVLIDRLQKDADPKVRAEAAVALGKIRDPAAYYPLLKATNDASADVREYAISGLGFLQDDRALSVLIKLFQSDPSNRVRYTCVWALWMLNDKKAVPPLLQDLPKEKDGDVRKAVVEAMGIYRETKAIPTLLKLNQTETERLYRVSLLVSFGRIGDARAIPALIAALRDKESSISLQARDSLAIMGPIAIPDLIQTIQSDQDSQARRYAITSLSLMRRGKKDDFTPILPQASTEPFRSFSGTIVDDPRILPTIQRAIQSDGDVKVREWAAMEVQGMKDPVSIPMIKTLLTQNVTPTIRWYLEGALSGMGTKGAQALIEIYQQEQDPTLRSGTLYALGESRDKSSADFARRLFKTDKEPQIRSASGVALARIEGVTAIPDLQEALDKDQSPVVRENVVRALRSISHPDTITPLRRALHDPEAKVRQAAVKGLLEVDPKGSSYLLIQTLDRDKNVEVRGEILSRLRTQDPKAISSFVKCLEREKKDYMRIWAALALGGTQNPKALPALHKAAEHDPNPDVRNSAKQAIEQISQYLDWKEMNRAAMEKCKQ